MSISVMIVDDEPFIHQLYRDILEYNGFNILAEAYDGQEAVDIYRTMEDKPRVVIMDHRMPKKDGVEATNIIKSMDPDVKIIFASADSTIKESALTAGAVDFLSKPFQIKDLMGAIKDVSA